MGSAGGTTIAGEEVAGVMSRPDADSLREFAIEFALALPAYSRGSGALSSLDSPSARGGVVAFIPGTPIVLERTRLLC